MPLYDYYETVLKKQGFVVRARSGELVEVDLDRSGYSMVTEAGDEYQEAIKALHLELNRVSWRNFDTRNEAQRAINQLPERHPDLFVEADE